MFSVAKVIAQNQKDKSDLENVFLRRELFIVIL